MTRIRRALTALACFALLACGRPVYFGDAVPFPEGCQSAERPLDPCAALVQRAEEQLGLHPSDIGSIDILTEDRCEADRTELCSRAGTAAPLSVRFVLTNGSSAWTTVYCPTNGARPWC